MAKEKDVVEQVEELVLGADEVNNKVLNDKWLEIISVFKETYPRVFHGLKNTNFTLDGTAIILQAKSAQVKKTIEDRLFVLTQNAQKVLNNKYVKISFDKKIATEEKTKTLYLVKDKFNHYLEQNKDLSILVNKFNLEL